MQARFVRGGFTQHPVNILYHHDRAIHHHADRDGNPAQRHQVGGDIEEFHGEKREADGERDRQRHHDAGSEPSHKRQ